MYSRTSPILLSGQPHPWTALPLPPPTPATGSPAPGEAECRTLWQRYAMPEHIQAHSHKVACLAVWLGEALVQAGLPMCVKTLQASAMLHDLAKGYTIQYKGNHAQLGAAWVMQETGQPLIAQGVLFHTFWPWEADLTRWHLPLLVQYADKRIMHDQLVSLDERFVDLMARYGHNERAKAFIARAELEAREIEEILLSTYKVDPYAYTIDCGRLV